jgi:hypothetical protein
MELTEVYDDHGAIIWLTANQVWPHPNGGTYHASPLSILREGRSEEVMQRIDVMRSGNFS